MQTLESAVAAYITERDKVKPNDLIDRVDEATAALASVIGAWIPLPAAKGAEVMADAAGSLFIRAAADTVAVEVHPDALAKYSPEQLKAIAAALDLLE